LHIERGRNKADRELPLRLPSPVDTLDPNIIISYLNGDAPMLALLREQTEQGVFHRTSILTGPQA
jgi:hypothetical protein